MKQALEPKERYLTIFTVSLWQFRPEQLSFRKVISIKHWLESLATSSFESSSPLILDSLIAPLSTDLTTNFTDSCFQLRALVLHQSHYFEIAISSGDCLIFLIGFPRYFKLRLCFQIKVVRLRIFSFDKWFIMQTTDQH